jgi:hypothetical protein
MSKDEEEKIPSVRELEALEREDRKVTEDLLSGFDRPGKRTPRAPRVRADFVEYYSGRSAPKVDAPPPSKREDSAPHLKPTVIVPRRDGFRATMTWIIAVVGMILFGVTIAVLSTPQTPASPVPSPVAQPTIAPTSATTITSANPQPINETAEPDTTTSDTVITPSPSSPKKLLPSTSITSGATSAPTIKTAPRDDFIRDM